MRKGILLVLLSMILAVALAFGADFQRKVVNVPRVDPVAITIDGKMLESAWTTAAKADLVTSAGFEIFTNKYYRESLVEPDYDELYTRMLWAKDTLYVFIHIDEIVNDSTNLFWDGQWTGDQLFVSLSNRLGVDMKGWYDGNVYASPDGPYHFLILADSVTLNNSQETGIPDEFMKFPTDTTRVFDAKKICRWKTTINKTTGVWDVEMAIYNPNVNANGRIGFNVGGSTGSTYSDTVYNDAYAYYTWQPCVVDSPYAQPPNVPVPSWGADPGYYNLATSVAWAILQFTPGAGDYVRAAVDVPKVDPKGIKIDGLMNETAWSQAAKANLVTAAGFDMFTNKYYRESLVEPDYDELYARMLWAKDTLYVFVHIDEIVNDSTDLFWDGQWTGDQLFVSLSNRLGVDMKGWYDGNVYAAPDGPFHYLILGNNFTLNNGQETGIPDEYMNFPTDTTRIFTATDYGRFATTINKTTGVWNVEMALYNPHVNAQSRIAFNFGGSTGSTYSDTVYNDAYAYYTWKPSVVDSPYVQPPNVPVPSWGADPGYYNLATSVAWPLLTFTSTLVTAIEDRDVTGSVPKEFALNQNYPNPFNPSTTIEFSLPVGSEVTLTVHNVLGQVVATLADGQLPAGRHQVRWNATKFASGTYFLQMRADGKLVSTRKMMLIK